MDFQEFTQKLFPKVISGKDLYSMFISASKKLEKYVELLNDVNVFPVPDGDTGINMYQTFKSIINELNKSNLSNHCCEVIKSAAKGAFFGCSGNSGIILTEYINGLEQEWKDLKIINKHAFAKGLFSGAKYAYQAVENPREGTILTVGRIISETADKWIDVIKNPFELLFVIFEEAKIALLNTHRILPEANFAGVIDAGALGLVLMFEGFIEAVIERYSTSIISNQTIDDDLAPFLKPKIGLSMLDSEFEVILKISHLNKPLDYFKFELRKEGKCLLILSNDLISEIKVHIHCKDPDRIIEKVKRFVDYLEVVSIQSINEQYNRLSTRINMINGGD